MKLHHGKKRNVGLVYEFLIREISSAAVDRDAARAAAAMTIIGENLSPGTVLFEELSLHRQVVGSRGSNERLARKIVDELKAAGIRLSAVPGRDRAKTSLIHEMNRSLGRDVFDRHRIPDYTAHASIGIMLSRGLDGRLDEGVELARIEEHLVSFICSEPGASGYVDPDATVFAYKKALSLFEKEYGGELIAEQRDILREYVRVSLGGNPAPFMRLFERQREELGKQLRGRRSAKEFRDDPTMATRLDEAISELDRLPADVDDVSVERLILYHNLRREIDS